MLFSRYLDSLWKSFEVENKLINKLTFLSHCFLTLILKKVIYLFKRLKFLKWNLSLQK